MNRQSGPTSIALIENRPARLESPVSGGLEDLAAGAEK